MRSANCKICVIIPAYNEEETLPRVIREVRRSAAKADIVVVNDASRDKTAHIARSEGVALLDMPINLGIGGAMTAGFNFADREGCEIVLQIDGDGQHDARFIRNVIKPIVSGEADVVIGSRFMGEHGYTSTAFRLLGIRLFTFLIGLATNRRITDPTSGFRAYNRKALEYVALHYPQDFPEPESIVLMLRRGLKVKEVPVVMRERLGGRSSVRPLKAGYFVASNAIAIAVSVLKSQR